MSLRFCDCGCDLCRAQKSGHESCSWLCEAATVDIGPKHGREIIVIGQHGE